MICKVCKHSGANMKRCKMCGEVWCQNCATRGMTPYPKQKAINVCPYCKKMNCIETAK